MSQPLVEEQEAAAGLAATVERQGFAVVENVVAPEALGRLREALLAADGHDARRRRGETFAMRNLLAGLAEVRALVGSRAFRGLVEPVLGRNALAVRGLLLDKTPAANWHVGWHQDTTIAVRRRREVPGFGPWSVKAGVPHVRPPASVLAGMLTLRLHLDDCPEGNGPLRVFPASHAQGLLDAAEVRRWRETSPPVTCAVGQGGVVLMRPLLLHASSPAAAPSHRRVLHIEFAGVPLPGGLEWAES